MQDSPNIPPFFTIITATYNAAATLPRLLQSLASQNYRDFELIIQDGASTDGTVNIAEQWHEKLPSLVLVSEPDAGIYDAWNKALGRTGANLGSWVLFLGADDRLMSVDTLAHVAEQLATFPPQHIFASGDVSVVDDVGEQLAYQYGLSNNVSQSLKECQPAVHSALFTLGSVFKCNKFDTSFRICGDHDFVTRCWTQDCLGKRLGFAVTAMAVGGMTSSINNVLRMRWELMRVVKRHFNVAATLPHYRGIIKAWGLFVLSLMLGSSKAARVHNMIRKFFHKNPSYYKVDN